MNRKYIVEPEVPILAYLWWVGTLCRLYSTGTLSTVFSVPPNPPIIQDDQAWGLGFALVQLQDQLQLQAVKPWSWSIGIALTQGNANVTNVMTQCYGKKINLKRISHLYCATLHVYTLQYINLLVLHKYSIKDLDPDTKSYKCLVYIVYDEHVQTELRVRVASPASRPVENVTFLRLGSIPEDNFRNIYLLFLKAVHLFNSWISLT